MSDINIEKVLAKPTVSPAGSRAALAVHPNEPASVIEPVAIAPVGATHKTSTEENYLHTRSYGLGQIKHEGNFLMDHEERRKQIDAILARLNHHKTQLDKNGDVSVISSQIDSDIAQLNLIGEDSSAPTDADADTTKDPATGANQGEATVERAMIASKIESALKRIGTLKSALSSADDRAYARLLNINASAAGLAAARVQMSGSNFGMVSASSTVDTLMSNLRATVIAAHGRLTPELMRLVFP